MIIGNKPKGIGEMPILNKRYWWFAVGRYAITNRYLEFGWIGVQFCILRKYKPTIEAGAIAYIINWQFAIWLPITFI